MSTPLNRLERRLRLAGISLVLGLLVEVVSLNWAHPTSFLVFMFLGGALMFFGIIVYIYALIRSGEVHI